MEYNERCPFGGLLKAPTGCCISDDRITTNVYNYYDVIKSPYSTIEVLKENDLYDTDVDLLLSLHGYQLLFGNVDGHFTTMKYGIRDGTFGYVFAEHIYSVVACIKEAPGKLTYLEPKGSRSYIKLIKEFKVHNEFTRYSSVGFTNRLSKIDHIWKTTIAYGDDSPISYKTIAAGLSGVDYINAITTANNMKYCHD